jgi:hypothetical protein
MKLLVALFIVASACCMIASANEFDARNLLMGEWLLEVTNDGKLRSEEEGFVEFTWHVNTQNTSSSLQGIHSNGFDVSTPIQMYVTHTHTKESRKNNNKNTNSFIFFCFCLVHFLKFKLTVTAMLWKVAIR